MSVQLETPKLDSLNPSSALTSDGEFMLEVHGTGFTMHSQVFFDGEGKATGMLGQDVLTAPMNPALSMGEAVEIMVSVKTGDHETPPLVFRLKQPEETDNEQGRAGETRTGEEGSAGDITG